MDASVRKYLSGHEAAEAKLALPLVAQERSWSQVMVVPAHAEAPDFVEGYRAALGAMKGHGLVIVVLNGREGDDAAAREKDLSAWAHFEAQGELIEAGASRARLCKHAAFDLLVVDRASDGYALAQGEGVGLARKIGCDLALALCAMGAVHRAWIHGTDADVRLARDHFENLPTDPKVVACLCPFAHVDDGDAEVTRVTLAYEMRLRWYVLGLQWARSHFAHHSVGSTISVRPSAYAKVRGYPKREAGEDFYLLDKLAKLGRIETRKVGPAFIRARRSSRVPFGTGPAVEKALGGDAQLVYDPAVFDALLRVNAALGAVARVGKMDALSRLCDEPHLGPALKTLGLPKAVELAVRSYPKAQLPGRMREAFDGFKTLRLIHELGRARWPEGALESFWADAEFLGDGRRAATSFEAKVDYLRAREGVRVLAGQRFALE